MNILKKSFWIIASISLTFAVGQYSFAQETQEPTAQESQQSAEAEAPDAQATPTEQAQTMSADREQVYFAIKDLISLALQNNLDISVKKIDPKVIDEEITNKERTIMYTSGGERFELTLIQKRKPKN